MNIREIESFLDQVLAGERPLYNVDFVELKGWLNRRLDEAHEAAQKAYLKVVHTPGHERSEELQNQYYGTIYPHTLAGWTKKLPKAASPAFAAALEAFRAVPAEFSPVCEKFLKAKLLVIKSRKPSDRPRVTPERTIDNTGTCSCCGQNVKLDGGRIVAHGYTIRYGYQSGSCAGVGFAPIEVSADGAKAYLRGLEAFQSRQQAALVEATRAGEKKRIWSIEADLRSLKIDIHHFTRVVADWAPKALPDGRKDHL